MFAITLNTGCLLAPYRPIKPTHQISIESTEFKKLQKMARQTSPFFLLLHCESVYPDNRWYFHPLNGLH